MGKKLTPQAGVSEQEGLNRGDIVFVVPSTVPWRRAVHAHLLHYRNLRSEQPLRDLVPLSDLGHRMVHAWVLWRGPMRPLMSGVLRLATIVLAVWVRPVVRYTALAVLAVGGYLVAQELRVVDWRAVTQVLTAALPT